MKLNIPNILRFVFGALIFFFYIMGLVQWQWFDGLIHWFAPLVYLIATVAGALMAAALYALLPTKKVVKATPSAIKEGGKNNRAVGYYLWLLFGVILFVIWLPFYINEM
jgi:hypothetical protein